MCVDLIDDKRYRLIKQVLETHISLPRNYVTMRGASVIQHDTASFWKTVTASIDNKRGNVNKWLFYVIMGDFFYM